MKVYALCCPGCGARLAPEAGARRAVCEFCDSVLFIETPNQQTIKVSDAPPAQPQTGQSPPAALYQFRGARFCLSMIEQLAGRGEIFTTLELGGERFALVYLRIVDADGNTIPAPPPPLEMVRDSLEAYADPGLAASAALEELSRGARGFSDRLECALVLFDPERCSALPYCAGCRDSLWWMSCLEGRTLVVGSGRAPLERRMLREDRDHFSNDPRILLAPGDLIVLVSAAYAGRGGPTYGGAISELTRSLNEELGEEPLRVVTLAKNAFWGRSQAAPEGPVRVAAVQPLQPPLVELVDLRLLEFGSRLFELALCAHPHDHVELLPLHAERSVLMWLSNHGLEVDADCVERARHQVLAVLDRPDHGDNENPRQAGRSALQAAGQPLSIVLIQLFDKFGRVKYFRHGYHQPLALGPRGLRDPGSLQQFDEGGEATVGPGGRLFYPGLLPYPDEVSRAEDLAGQWPGGRCSRLLEALQNHWRTPPTAACLRALAAAALSDRPGSLAQGLALVSGRKL